MNKAGSMAKVYKVGKSEYAVSKAVGPASYYQVYRLVRGYWQHIASYPTFSEAQLCIFRQTAVEKGMITI